MVSMNCEASRIAIIMARAVFGYFCTNSAVVPSTFSGWSFHISCVVTPVETDLVVDSACTPRLAHAVAIHIADAHIGHHLRRRHG